MMTAVFPQTPSKTFPPPFSPEDMVSMEETSSASLSPRSIESPMATTPMVTTEPPPTSASSPPAMAATPPSLFQPFLDHHHQNDEDQRSSSPSLSFSIDNILKPSFGQRLLLHRMAAAAAFSAAAAVAVAAQQKMPPSPPPPPPPPPPQRQHQQQQEEPHVVKEEPPSLCSPPPSLSSSDHHSSNGSSNNNNNQPVDLSAKTSLASNGSDPGSGGGGGDVPPGMVRGPNGQLWPAWVFCTRYSDRPSSGPRSRKIKKAPPDRTCSVGEKRPRTAFSSEQLSTLKREFEENRYLTEERRKNLADSLGLNENQIKIWFQNKRAKLKKSSGQKGELAQMLAAQGLYNHSTIPVDEDDNPLL